MKFVTLALALLLAVGSQAASLQADAPSNLAYIRSAMDVYINQIKESTLRALDQVDDADLKARLVQHVNNAHTQLKSLQQNVSPMTDTVVETVMSSTAELRASMERDIEALKVETDPLFQNLNTILTKHIDEYKEAFTPIMEEYQRKHTEEAESLKTRLEPVFQRMQVNLEETKTALIPLVEAVRTKVNGLVEGMRSLTLPYIQEYRDQLRTSLAEANANPEEMAKTVKTMAKEYALKLKTIVDGLAESAQKA
uniref:apolipoprotein A-I-like n=1 Tax=Semicossyphus pulcher TaxID=241346 RepID=UPI0037E99A96